jgi:hypothetical protein
VADGAAHRGFDLLVRVAAWLDGAPPRWAFHGGWALDAWAGAPTRLHEDVDVAVDRHAAVAVLDRLQGAGVDVDWVVPGARGAAAHQRRRVGEAPRDDVHQAHARRGDVRVDVVLEPWTDGAWRYRRAPEIELPLERAVRFVRVDGVELPLLAPAAVLLFKATTVDGRRSRPKDDLDLKRARAKLAHEDVAWLRAALDAVAPGHPWGAPAGPLA